MTDPDTERDAARWRYAVKHLRIGKMHYDSWGECSCEFDDMDPSVIDKAIAEGAKPCAP